MVRLILTLRRNISLNVGRNMFSGNKKKNTYQYGIIAKSKIQNDFIDI